MKKDYYKLSYWKDWYWNKGGRAKVQAKRKINDYLRHKKPEQYKDAQV